MNALFYLSYIHVCEDENDGTKKKRNIAKVNVNKKKEMYMEG